MTNQGKMMVVDDDEGIREVVRLLLSAEGYQVTEAENGSVAVDLADNSYDLIILDVMMPGLDGFRTCQQLRQKTLCPILFLTAKTEDSDKTLGFSAGGDDYLVKPFSYSELTARVKALRRRYRDYSPESQRLSPLLTVADLTIDTNACQVHRGKTEIHLTGREYQILLLLARNRSERILFDSLDQMTGGDGSIFEDAEPRTLAFADGNAQVVAYIDLAGRDYLLVYTLAWVLAAACFIGLFTLLIRRRIGYVLALEREMHILEGGDLSHAISVTGSDELSLLAGSINEMRLSVLERQAAKERAEAAGRGLVASMSHDLRTPLTALIGYLELVANGRYESGEQRIRFEKSALEKAYRIKAMTDELFRYALGRLGQQESPAAEPVEMSLFLQQVIADEQFDLGEAGLLVQWADQGTGRVLLDPERLLRVFDNLFSNARKYAAPDTPVRLSWTREGDFFRVDMVSQIRRDAPSGTGLGLPSCAAIVEAAGGAMNAREEEGSFHVTLLLPLCREPQEEKAPTASRPAAT